MRPAEEDGDFPWIMGVSEPFMSAILGAEPGVPGNTELVVRIAAVRVPSTASTEAFFIVLSTTQGTDPEEATRVEVPA